MSVNFEPVRTEPAYKVVSQAIQTKILSGDLPVGETLPSEMALADQLGVNRGTVREAIRQLEQDGLLRRREGGKKLFVSVPEQSAFSRRMKAMMIMQEVTFRELWEVMSALEPVAAESSARAMSGDLLERLADNIEQTRVHMKDLDRLVELDIEFHDIIVEGSGNRALKLSHDAISSLFYAAFHKVFTKLNAGERLLVAHESIFNAIKDQDQIEARAWMVRHIEDFRRGYELANLDMDGIVERPSSFSF